MKTRLLASFSGGLTSAFMTKWLLDNCADEYEILPVFANTGQENEQTLEFVRRCDEAWGLNVVWVEAVVHHEERKASTHRIVTFETASRNGEPFEEAIKKYGVPNVDFQPCNRELKWNAMDSYMESIGWFKSDYVNAIGIRADEARRVDEKKSGLTNFVYPLIDWWPTDKQDINTFWEDQPFRLQLQEHEGNCKWCFKKSDKKQFRLISERPWIYDFPRRMEQLYGFHGGPYYGNPPPGAKPRKIFRQNRSTDELFAQAKALGVTPFIPIREIRSHAARQLEMDLDAGCSESCEPYPMQE
jgi:hypothetical protein